MMNYKSEVLVKISVAVFIVFLIYTVSNLILQLGFSHEINMINKYKEDEILFQKKEVELQNEFNKFVKKNKVISKRVIEESELKDAIQDLKAIVAINKALFITSNRVKKDRKKNTKKGYINIGYINFQYTINRKKNITYEIANVLLKQYIKVVFKGRFKEYKAIYKNGSVDIKVKK